MRKTLFTLIVGTMLTSMPAAAQEPQTVPPGSDKPVPRAAQPRADQQKLVAAIGQGGLAEVAAGQSAQRRAKTPAVRQFADKMVADHSRGNTELAAAAAQANIVAPTQMTPEHQKKIEGMNGLPDTEFERAYIQGQIKDHRAMIELHRELQASMTPALADYASRTLPKLEEHLRMAEMVEHGLKG